ncbi:MAG: hypothetical protein GX595_19110 [Lentisphaerae bacterium]|nr:hypothetical protein [Lentisphaerota bacterium]
MNPRLTSYDVTPRLLTVGETAEVRIRPRFHHAALPAAARVEVVVCERDTRQRHPIEARRDDAGGLTVCLTPQREQEIVLAVTATVEGQTARREEFPLFAVRPDLIGLRPWKGDIHLHSSRSDGREAPAYVAAACRQIGLDFMALTDHRNYRASLEAQAAFQGLAIDFRIFPGEEVHPPDNPVHMVNAGGSFSVQDLMADRAAYDAEIARRAEAMPPGLTPDERRMMASCQWVFEQIRRGDGISILCHPYWITGDAHNITEDLQDALYAARAFDTLEVIGGFFRHQMESNALAVARWQQCRAAGQDMPVVGVSDAHGCERGELFGWYYSIVFAPSTDWADLRQAMRDSRSLAVEAVSGEFPRLVGPFRLVKLGYFMLREILPLHDELCVEEGRLMRGHAAGDTAAARALEALGGRVAALYDSLWGRADNGRRAPSRPA